MFEHFFIPASHNRQGCGFCPAVTTGYWSVQHGISLCLCCCVQLFCQRGRRGCKINQYGMRFGMCKDTVIPLIDFFHILWVTDHGTDNIRITYTIPNGTLHPDSLLEQGSGLLIGAVIGTQRMTALFQVQQHAGPHHAAANPCNLHMITFLLYYYTGRL